MAKTITINVKCAVTSIIALRLLKRKLKKDSSKKEIEAMTDDILYKLNLVCSLSEIFNIMDDFEKDIEPIK